MRKLLTGNSAISLGVMLCRAEVISAYPITPQTTIVEELSEIVADGRLKAKFIRVSAASLAESHPHDIVITQEAPNYLPSKIVEE